MVTRAGFLFVAAMVGASALLAGMPMAYALWLGATVVTVSMMLPTEGPGRRHRFRTDDEEPSAPKRTGDCRDLAVRPESSVQPRDGPR
jgi:hypothetical protein